MIDVESLAEEFHLVYTKELQRQGVSNRHPDEYSKLLEPLKDIDRALARHVLVLLAKERDTAHAAAIQAAADRALKVRVSQHDTARDIYDAILALTPVDAQRLYDLRIAEAVKREARWWHAQQSGEYRVVQLHEEADKRLASASAEVERLRAPAAAKSTAPAK